MMIFVTASVPGASPFLPKTPSKVNTPFVLVRDCVCKLEKHKYTNKSPVFGHSGPGIVFDATSAGDCCQNKPTTSVLLLQTDIKQQLGGVG